MDEEEYTPTWADEAEVELRGVIRQMKRALVYRDPYEPGLAEEAEAMADMLDRVAAELRGIRGHQHVWDDRDICIVCELDGRS